MILATLTRHPVSAGPFFTAFTAQLDRPAAARLAVRFRIEGEIDRLLIPATVTPHRVDGLWKHTCFEAFIKEPGSAAYHEFNFSPSGDWAAYRFDGYRSGMTEAIMTDAPRIMTTTTAEHLEITVDILLPAEFASQERTQRASLSAVIEDCSDHLSYWAVAHAPDKPDFHHDNGFVLNATAR